MYKISVIKVDMPRNNSPNTGAYAERKRNGKIADCIQIGLQERERET